MYAYLLYCPLLFSTVLVHDWRRLQHPHGNGRRDLCICLTFRDVATSFKHIFSSCIILLLHSRHGTVLIRAGDQRYVSGQQHHQVTGGREGTSHQGISSRFLDKHILLRVILKKGSNSHESMPIMSRNLHVEFYHGTSLHRLVQR